ncbi:DUF4124 domain-containing protein, partial [Salmonella sp. s59311]|uniref:DUF4124 domain-containing protein n=1 Tax=Salmonella sp. s59311 TaxID=3159715 RepID=UPI00397F0A42
PQPAATLPRMPWRWLLPLLLTLPALPAAHAQVRRCQAPNGQVIYTDRPCDTVGGVEYRQPPRPHTVPTWTCARTVRDLVTETQRQPIPITDPDRMRNSIAEHRRIIAALR